MAVLDDEAFGAATDVVPKFVSPADPAARWTGAHGGQAFFAYSTNYLIDVDNGIIVDVEATTAIRQAEVLAQNALGRPSIDPELLIRMLIVGYCFGIRSERRLCEEAHLNLAYRWFCRLGLDGDMPDHSTFSKNRHGRFRESDFLRRVFETVLQRCIAEGLVGGEAFAIGCPSDQGGCQSAERDRG
jgi:transposase